jgi:hypothetical protein
MNLCDTHLSGDVHSRPMHDRLVLARSLLRLVPRAFSSANILIQFNHAGHSSASSPDSN